MAPGTLTSKRRKAEASPSPPPSPAVDGGSDSSDDLHDPEDSFYSARSGSEDDHDDLSSNDDDDEEEEDEEEMDEEEEEEEQEEEEEEMNELEEEYRTLQANQHNILETLKQHRDDDVSRGQAVKNQKVLWDKALEMRFLLQKAFSTSNKLPKEPIKSMFCDHSQEIEQAYLDLLNSSKQTLDCMMELQEALLERNHATKDSIDAGNSSELNEEDDEWPGVQKLQRRITSFRNNEIDKWQRKTQVTTGAAALKGKLHAFNQNISDQVTSYMRDPSRMIKRMYLRKSTLGVYGEEVGELGNNNEERNTEGDPELIDDSEFYQQLLKEFLESCDVGASESAFYALKKQQHKKRKLVDRRASKSRKIRYHVHEKIANFMAPVPMVVPPMTPKLFENLFGMGNQKSTTA
ncbi:protein AATF [Oryza brachyantha]|uniref:Apoptosis-antagonizing transcription factor C-terminal domain-containing protein n=1 Tax=Oryza brachyantha TaxID=4533 RepID=J3L0M4_ORYBR|nr:protein AATF [Oryza brachyantha]